MQPQTKVEGRTNALKDFEQYMSSYGIGWTLTKKQSNMLDYQKVIPYQRGSCLVAFLLFCLGIIPGIIYMFYGRTDAVTRQLIVRMHDDGVLTASGDQAGMNMYARFVNRNQSGGGQPIASKPVNWKRVAIIGCIGLVLFIALLVYLTAVNKG